METLSNKVLVTRKPHRCWGCGREFPPGSTLRKVVSVDCGDFASTYWCGICDEMWSQMPMWEQEEGVYEGELCSNDPDMWNEVAARLAMEANSSASHNKPMQVPLSLHPNAVGTSA